MGLDSPRAFAACYLDWTLAGGIAKQITCRPWCATARPTCSGQANPKLFDHLTCSRTLLQFINTEGANTGAHSQFGAQRLAYARIYNWLDVTLAIID
jgi:hypothetical protein